MQPIRWGLLAAYLLTTPFAFADMNPAATPPDSPPIMNWTEFRGKVTRVDAKNEIVQIREEGTDTLIEVPVNQNVSIYKQGGRNYGLQGLKEGDSITIKNNEEPS